MAGWVVVVLMLGGCFVTPVHRFGGGKSRQQVVYEAAEKITPTRVRAVGAWPGEVQTKKVRVWADDEYRAQHVRWQEGFQEILDDANDILAAQFGVRLTAEYVSWSYRPSPGQPLEETLAALTSQDPGTGAFVVVGLTSSLSLVTSTFDQLGVGQLPGRYLVIRGYSDIHERQALEMSFVDLTKQDRTLMFDARKHHKRLSLLLHELGHVFGADHAAAEPSSLMMPSYSVQANQFDAASRTSILATLDSRLQRTSRRPADPVAAEPAKPAPPPPPVERKPLTLDPRDTTPVIEIIVDAQGRRTVNGKLQADAMLDGLLLLAFDKHKRTRIYVRVDAGSPVEIVNDVVARAKKVGLQRVTVTDD